MKTVPVDRPLGRDATLGCTLLHREHQKSYEGAWCAQQQRRRRLYFIMKLPMNQGAGSVPVCAPAEGVD